MIIKIKTLLLLSFLLFAVHSASYAQYEKIQKFKSTIEVKTNGNIVVTEEITVYAGGLQIKRGIYRKLPVKYLDRYNNSYKARYNIISVLRDGKPEGYHIKSEAGNKVIYIGNEDVFLLPGTYTYTIKYEALRQIGFFEHFDEIYWNVTGNEWGFDIDSAEAVVILPPGAEIITSTAYTGKRGEKGSYYSSFADEESKLHFVSTATLFPSEGLTVAVSFPKGIVKEPDTSEKILLMFADNAGLVAGIIIFLLVLVYFIVAWFKAGKDPEKGAEVVMYFPPSDLSPAAMRYIHKMSFDNKCLASDIVNMAVKKYLRIENKNKKFTLIKIAETQLMLSEDEKVIADALFEELDSIKLENINHKRISKSIQSLRKTLSQTYHKVMFHLNTMWYVPGLLFSLLGVILMFALSDLPVEFYVSSIGLFIWSAIGIMLFINSVKSFRRGSIAGGVVLLLVFLLFALAAGIALWQFLMYFNIGLSLLLVLYLFLNILFRYLLKAPTIAGRKLMDSINGFKTYLATAEKDELNLKNPPDKTPELFEKYLPYAIALGVENKWGEKFSKVIEAAIKDGSYEPSWYHHGMLHTFSATAFATSLSSSFSGAFTASATAPGSSSGSGGGGFSGGGGGGGGGGGW